MQDRVCDLKVHQFAFHNETAVSYWLESGSGAKVHFYGANGFTPEAYGPFLLHFSDRYSLSSLANRALWPGSPAEPVHRLGCRQYCDDLIDYLQQQNCGPVIGMGHSMGATMTLLAAIERPALFRQLILIEPVFQSWQGQWLSRLLPWSMLRRFQPFKATLSRSQNWPDFTAAFTEFRSLPMFRRLDDATLRQLTAALTVNDGPGLRLAFRLEWELHNYKTLDAIWHTLRRCQLPVLIVHGRPSLFLNQTKLNRLQGLLPQSSIIGLPSYGHLLPIEAPRACAEAVLAKIE